MQVCLQYCIVVSILLPKTTLSITSGKKEGLHIRNKHIGGYDFNLLISTTPELQKYLKKSTTGTSTVDFGNPSAVKILNRALLRSHYKIDYFDFPGGYLCPPVPGRADYIHHISDVLSEVGTVSVLNGSNVCGLDIGTGANLIYPIIGVAEYGWKFVAVDTNSNAIESCRNLIKQNIILHGCVDVRFQTNPQNIFMNIKNKNEKFDFTMCNPPFHKSLEAAKQGTERKWNGLGKPSGGTKLNFDGKEQELVYPGGEINFIETMIRESSFDFIRKDVLWFTTLVSKESNLNKIYKLFESNLLIKKWDTIDMSHGNKKSRIVAWTYLSREERDRWRENWV